MEGLGAKFSRGHRHQCWTVASITGTEEAPHLRWGNGGLGRTKVQPRTPLALPILKPKVVLKRKNIKEIPHPCPALSRIPTTGTSKRKF